METEEILIDMTDENSEEDNKTPPVNPVETQFASVIIASVAAIEKMVETLPTSLDTTLDAYGKSAAAFTKSLTSSQQTPHGAMKKTTATNTADLEKEWAKLTLALATAEDDLKSSVSSAKGDFEKAMRGWNTAKSTFSTSLSSDLLSLNGGPQSPVQTAIKTYTDAINDDSKSRRRHIYFTMENAVATAVSGYTTEAEGAVATLASAAAAVIEGYAKLTSAWATATAKHQEDVTNTWMSYWSDVEGILDKT